MGGVSGVRLRALRETRSLTQAALARALDISPSYLNQIEHGSRPLTVPVLMRISEVFGVDAAFFAARRPERLVAELHEAFTEVARPGVAAVPAGEIERMATDLPVAAEAVLELFRRYRQSHERHAADPSGAGHEPPRQPHEEVREYFYRRRNHVAELDDAAEQLAVSIGVRPGEARRALADQLGRHGVSVVGFDEVSDGDDDGRLDGPLHHYDPARRVLHLSAHLRPGQQAFRMATQLAYLEQEPLIAALTDEAGTLDPASRTLVRIGLATYYAAALLLPYTEFQRTAEGFRYDVERLCGHYALGYETVAQRLSTLQRSAAPGVPFSFVRVDRAGNMSKGQSATGFHFSRSGVTCPLWNVYQAFSSPGAVHVQVAAMPDGARYLWVARTVLRGRGGWGSPGKAYAVALGCELRHAGRLVYSTGLDLDDPAAATPIGPGCRACPRDGCPQRAVPRAGGELAIRESRSTFVPYPTRTREP